MYTTIPPLRKANQNASSYYCPALHPKIIYISVSVYSSIFIRKDNTRELMPKKMPEKLKSYII